MGEPVCAQSAQVEGGQWLDVGHMGSYGRAGETAEQDQPCARAFLLRPDDAFTAAFAWGGLVDVKVLSEAGVQCLVFGTSF